MEPNCVQTMRKSKVYVHDTTLRSQNAEQLRENGWLRCTVLYMSTVYCILSLILDLILNMILNWGPRKAGTQVRWRRPWLATRCISRYCTLADAVTRRGLIGGADFSTDRTDAWIPMGHGCPAQLRTHDYTEMLPLSECYTLTCDIGSLFLSLVPTYCTIVAHVYFYIYIVCVYLIMTCTVYRHPLNVARRHPRIPRDFPTTYAACQCTPALVGAQPRVPLGLGQGPQNKPLASL